MTDTRYILAIDQGTTSSRAIVFDANGRSVAVAQQEFPQHFPNSGWVEHDPEDLWDTVVAVCPETLSHVDFAMVAPSASPISRETPGGLGIQKTGQGGLKTPFGRGGIRRTGIWFCP